jgi:predicted nucleic acid-binding protein
MAIVFDCSVALAWFLEDERTTFSDAALELLEQAEGWVPSLWRLEFANALLVAERRRRIDREARLDALERAARLELRVDSEPVDMRAVSAIAERRALTVYDAAYIELGLRLGTGLVTLDRDLAAAAAAEGLAVHAPGRSSAAQLRRRYAAQPARDYNM